MKPIKLISGAMTVGFWTLLSRVMGLIRDIMLQAFIGPGPVMDAFVVAFRLPNMFRRLFAEGAFNSAFVPLFSKRLEADDNPQGFASEALSGLAFCLLILTGLALVFMPALVWATAGDLAGGRFDLATGYGRIMFPYILMISLAALFSGVLNASGHFAAAAAAPVLLNILLVGVMTTAWILGGEIILWVAWTIPFAGIAQLVLVWIAADRSGMRIRPGRPRLSDDMKHLIKVALPAALAGGVLQINLMVGQWVAEDYPGAISWLFGADRLYQLPLGVVGIAIGIVLLPDLSRRLKSDDLEGSRNAFSRAGEFSMALTLPAAMALLVIPLPLVSVLFERGATGPDDSFAMSQALAIYALGLPAFVLQKLLQPLYFAREDTRSPFRFALYSMIANVALAFGLQPIFGWLSPAWATTLSAWIMVLCLGLGARKFGDVARFDARFHRRFWRIGLATVIMGGALWAAYWATLPLLTLAFWRYFALLALIIFGLATYAAAGQLCKAFSLQEFKRAFKRG